MVTLKKMTEKEFLDYKEFSISEYAKDLVKGKNKTQGQARNDAKKEFEFGLPNGLDTKNSFLMNIEDEDGKTVGWLLFQYGTNKEGNSKQVFLEIVAIIGLTPIDYDKLNIFWIFLYHICTSPYHYEGSISPNHLVENLYPKENRLLLPDNSRFRNIGEASSPTNKGLESSPLMVAVIIPITYNHMVEKMDAHEVTCLFEGLGQSIIKLARMDVSAWMVVDLYRQFSYSE